MNKLLITFILGMFLFGVTQMIELNNNNTEQEMENTEKIIDSSMEYSSEGGLERAKIYNRPLTEREIYSIYESGISELNGVSHE